MATRATGQKYVVLTGVAVREGEQFVSRCKELGVASCGDTPEEALDNLKDALEVYLSDLEETGEVRRVLKEKKVPLYDKRRSVHTIHDVPVGTLVMTYQERVKVLEAA